MSTTQGQLPEHDRPSKPKKRTTSELARSAGFIALGVLVTLFAVLNLDKVEVNWIIGSGEAPLIIVIVVSVLVGILMGYLGQRLAARRRRN